MRYKIYQGDCLEVMDKLIEKGIKVDMILTDPPYGTTRNKWDSIIPLDEMWKRSDKLIKPNGAIVLFAQTPFDKVLGASNLKMLRYEWIWDKKLGTGHLNAKKMPMKQHENILVFYKKLPTYNPQMREGQPYHKTSSNEGDIVLDCFMGSGSTGVACLNTNRRFIGIELNEKYFNIAKNRLENIK